MVSLCAIGRNGLVLKNWYTKKTAVVYLCIVWFISIFNINGAMSVLPIISHTLYSISLLFDIRAVKLGIICDCAIWVVYLLYLQNYASTLLTIANLVLAVISLIQHKPLEN